MKTPLDWLTDPVLVPNAGTAERARRRQESLTKPPGSLGRLEDLAIWFAGRQGGVRPAMTEAQLAAACRAGLDAVERARAAEAQLFVGAEMGA